MLCSHWYTWPCLPRSLGFNDAGPVACVTHSASTGYKGSVSVSVAAGTTYWVVVSPLTDGDQAWQARLSLTLA